MPIVRTSRTEHYKIADFSFVELKAEVEDEFSSTKEGLTENHKVLNTYFNSARKQLKEAFQAGEFDLLD